MVFFDDYSQMLILTKRFKYFAEGKIIEIYLNEKFPFGASNNGTLLASPTGFQGLFDRLQVYFWNWCCYYG